MGIDGLTVDGGATKAEWIMAAKAVIRGELATGPMHEYLMIPYDAHHGTLPARLMYLYRMVRQGKYPADKAIAGLDAWLAEIQLPTPPTFFEVSADSIELSGAISEYMHSEYK